MRPYFAFGFSIPRKSVRLIAFSSTVDLTIESVSPSRILDTTQIRRLIAFSSVTDLTRQRFNDSTMHKLSLAEGFAMRRGNWGGSKN